MDKAFKCYIVFSNASLAFVMHFNTSALSTIYNHILNIIWIILKWC